MYFVTGCNALLWNFVKSDSLRSTIHAIASVFLSCLCLDYPNFEIQNFNICMSLGYFIADLRYVIANRQHPIFIAHHLISIYILYALFHRYPDKLHYSKLMLIEASTPFINIYVLDKECKIKWVVAGFVFFFVRIVYFPIISLNCASHYDEYFFSFILYLGNLWWFRKLIKI